MRTSLQRRNNIHTRNDAHFSEYSLFAVSARLIYPRGEKHLLLEEVNPINFTILPTGTGEHWGLGQFCSTGFLPSASSQHTHEEEKLSHHGIAKRGRY